MVECRTADGVRAVSDSEVLVVFVTLNTEGTARNISETHKIVYLSEAYREKYKLDLFKFSIINF
jgi:hypothetical protein